MDTLRQAIPPEVSYVSEVYTQQPSSDSFVRVAQNRPKMECHPPTALPLAILRFLTPSRLETLFVQIYFKLV